MILSSTIVKGRLASIIDPTEGQGIARLHIEEASTTYAVPSSNKLIDGLKLRQKIGQTLIVTAILNADGTFIDTMSVLMPPE